MTQLDLLTPPVEPPAPTPNPVADEVRRLNAAALRVLAHLKLHGSALNWQLTTPELGGIRAAGRIWELTEAGYDIRKEHVERGTWRWTFYGFKGCNRTEAGV